MNNQIFKVEHISKFGLITSLLFMLFSLLGRVLYPFGDEPDFTIRAPKVLYGEHPWWSPYNIFHDLLININIFSECKIDAGTMSLWASIDYYSCTESLEQIFIRFFMIMIVVSPLLYAIVFRKSFISMVYILPIKLTQREWNNRLDTLSLTLLFSGIIYNVGVLAEEQFVLLIALFLFLFWGSWIIMLSLFFLIASIDLGNSMVILLFIGFATFFYYISKTINTKTSLFLMVGVILFAYIVGFTFLNYLENIMFISNKVEAMNNSNMQGVTDKYPIILRPIITFITAIFYTPSGVKVISLYVLYVILIIRTSYKLKKSYITSYQRKSKYNHIFQIKKYKLIHLLSAMTTIIFFIFLFPGYSNAKYYIFLIPFILYPILDIYPKKNIFKLFIMSNTIIVITLTIFKI